MSHPNDSRHACLQSQRAITALPSSKAFSLPVLLPVEIDPTRLIRASARARFLSLSAITGSGSRTNLVEDTELTAFWTASGNAKQEAVDGVNYMVLKDGQLPLEGEALIDKLLVRQCYPDLAGLVKDYLERKRPTGEQIPGQIFILRGSPGNSATQCEWQIL